MIHEADKALRASWAAHRRGASENRPHQHELFTPGGSPYSVVTHTRELRAQVLEGLAGVFGADVVQGVACPECCGEVRSLVATGGSPTAFFTLFCTCDWFQHIDVAELDP